jgi:hypothetical protein
MPVELRLSSYLTLTGVIVTALLSVSNAMAGTEDCKAASHGTDFAETLRARWASASTPWTAASYRRSARSLGAVGWQELAANWQTGTSPIEHLRLSPNASEPDRARTPQASPSGPVPNIEEPLLPDNQ